MNPGQHTELTEIRDRTMRMETKLDDALRRLEQHENDIKTLVASHNQAKGAGRLTSLLIGLGSGGAGSWLFSNLFSHPK